MQPHQIDHPSGSTVDGRAEREQRLRRACADLDHRIRRGENCRAEDYFAVDKPHVDDVSAALDLIYTEIVAREGRGETVTLEEYTGRFPQWQEALQRQFAIHEMYSRATEKSTPPPEPGPGEAGVETSALGAGRVGDYDLLDSGRRGAAGIVYQARHRRLGHLVAIKMLLAGDHATVEQQSRFQREAEVIARLRHPHVVRLYEMGRTAEGRPYLVLEWLDGGSLAERLNEGLPRLDRAARLIESIARAAHVVHGYGVVHRDLTPANILLDEHDEPKITDFGLAKWVETASNSTRTGDLHGTPCYVAPEQLTSPDKVDARADVYGLGAILYELLTGRPPFLGATPLDTLRSVATSDPVAPERLRPGAPSDLCTICLRCLDKNPARRYPTAEALADDLERYLRNEPILARRTGWGERAWKWAVRNPLAATLAVPAVLAPLALAASSVIYAGSLREAWVEAETSRALAVDRRGEVERQLELSRRTVYAMQLAQVDSLWARDPGRALALLEDPTLCPPDLREVSWRLFAGLCRRERQILRGHQNSVMLLAYMPDGRQIVTAGVDGTLRLWNCEDGSGRIIGRHSREVKALAVSPDGKFIASADIGAPGSMRIEPCDGSTQPVPLIRHQSIVTAVAYSPDGQWLASASDDATCLWKLPEGVLACELEGAGHSHLAFSPDGSQLALASRNGPSMLWDLKINREILRFETTGGASFVRFSPDGSTVALVQAFQGAELFQAADGRRLCRLTVPNSRISALAFSRDGKRVYTTGSDKFIREWDAVDGTTIAATAAHGDDVWAVDVSPDGQFLATGSGDQTAKVWEVATYRHNPAELLPDVRKPLTLAISPDRRLTATGGEDGKVWIGQWDQPHQWDVLGDLEGTVTEVLFSADSKRLYSTSGNGKVTCWDVSSKKMLESYDEPASILAAALSADGRTLAMAVRNRSIALRDLRTGAVRREFGDFNVWSLSFACDGKTLTVGTDQGELRQWDPESTTLRTVATLLDESSNAPERGVVDLAFSPDGLLCAASNRSGLIVLFDAIKWERLQLLRGHSAPVQSLVFSADGRTLASGTGMIWESASGEVKLWDVATGHNLATFPGKQGPVAFSPNGSSLLTAGDGTGLWLFSGVDENSTPKQDGRTTEILP
ncbi:MAG TPA: serine/threonine-protein kinase [Caulifigura sp.]|nr:serine/threonine-protein kinase [Caulifigura sp.]